ncbi:ATP-binding protein [Pantanalinema rosaneae CENA516]|uniref:ATP-binding protein n=1 Tax=Pantanalinema rosaneae TaxID=1620701 RepID=UPI003D6E5A54
MTAINFKRILTKREVLNVLHDLVNAFEIELSVQDATGNPCLQIGSDQSSSLDVVESDPIYGSGAIVGWVSCRSQSDRSITKSQNVAIATLLSHLINQEIEKKSLAHELLEKYEEIDLFQDVSTQITTSLDLQELTQLVIEETRKVIASTRGAVLLVDAATEPLRVLAAFGQPWYEATPPQLGEGILGQIVASGQGEIVNEVISDAGVSALIAVPMRVKDQVIGAIVLSHDPAIPYTTHDLKLLTIFASQAAIAIEKALLYEQSCMAALSAQIQAQQLQQTLQELKQTQAQLIQTEKMSSLGQLVAGVAHEINNPINFIGGNLSPACEYALDLLNLLALYQQCYPQPLAVIQEKIAEIDLDFLTADLPKLLSSMRLGVDRIQKIVLSLKNFSRLDQTELSQVNLHEGLDSTLLILQHRLKANGRQVGIQIIKEYGELPPVECYAGQLNQVFMNLISNAIDALEESTQQFSDTQRLPSAMASCPLPTIWLRTEWQHPDQIVIRIRDNGIGIPSEVQEKLFDAFFTTKPIGKGTGLGLSISHQIIVDKHGGSLHCCSRSGEGTEFVIVLPVRAITPSPPAPTIAV